MKKISFILILLTIFFSVYSQRQQGQGQRNGIIYGNIVSGGEALSFASVSLFSARDSSLSSGIIADEKGRFELKSITYGRYYLKVTFVGFRTLIYENIEVNEENSMVKLNDLNLENDLKALEEVEVTSSTPTMEFQIDKKVVNVDKQITSASGTAVDVLQNVPSVQVSISGEVTLRGSSGFVVFIDGRPSALSGTEALNQIPASSIDKIELITNPSAKYDAEGKSGIINIVTKKNKMQGFSGVVNGNIGWDDKYGGDFLLYFRKNKINYFVGTDYNHRYFPGLQRTSRITDNGDTVFLTRADGDNDRTSTRYQFKGGIESNLSVHDYLTLSANIGFRSSESNSDLEYAETTLPYQGVYKYTSLNSGSRSGGFYSISSDYEHKFNNEDHKISAQVVYNARNSEERNDNELIESDGVVSSGQLSTENGPGTEFRTRIDYVLPIRSKMRLEAGGQLRSSVDNDTNKIYSLNYTSQEYEFQPLFSNSVRYKQDIYALYGILRDEKNKFGYQIGMRTEYTGRNISKISTDYSTDLYRWDFFPSAHVSYQLPKDNQIMASYARRIERPRGYNLEPFITWVDAYNVRQGNPDLLPEYIDSYELGYNKKIKKTNISFETYYRQVHNKIESFKSVYEENIIMSTFTNVGNDHSLGVEAMVSTDIYKWWNIDVMGNLYYFRGQYTIQNLNNESTNWNARINQTFYVNAVTQVQLNGNYQSPSISAQGEVYDSYSINAAVKRTFYSNKLSMTLQVSDIFRSNRRQSISSGTDFYSEDYSRMISPIVILNASYRFNNYKSNAKNRESEGEGGEEF